ncbi:bifunctional 3-(3-hydroxy-phenyl)propionate/3-hydroxycinnamic acid hydroxylase [uncultured Ruegeria sp.]|uniref:bifunctional 3-(3-hydroxy-phenyl)propionate/3-hydroxycinnamic acid hydroxylase MhpA n=1 Tax=uncultured Ruegeria sp. TaxID=259304 RepID=UPI0026318CEC|nr:bifunctional 3-(3-hydroxy-phenyl)propionate/3-hydroxycinnamic acid hydroxylase [uncultured Ruegeria sp.]
MYDVAIIGFGPTGATLANLLAKSGVSVVVLDREAQMYHLPRAVHFDDEVMRVFQTIGIADALFKRVHVNPGMKFVDEDGELLLDWPRPQDVTKHGWHASYRLHQPDLETLLRAKLARRPSATILEFHNVINLVPTGNGVELTALDRKNERNTVISARYVTGCDGANSSVRRWMGSEMEDLGFEERWLVADVLLKHPMPELGDHSIQFCNPDRPMTYCRAPGIRRRWEIMVLDGETDVEIMEHARLWDLLSRWITPENAEIERSAVYTFRSQVAKIWRKGPVLIAGDAAHLTPPFMGQGMCTGIRDAANLAWKLVNAINGGDEELLLSSYQDERLPHARSYIETAVRLGGLINSLDRNSALQLADGSHSGAMRSIAPKLGKSALMDVRENTQFVGHPFPQMRLDVDGQWLDDLVGYNHLLISRTSLTECSDNAVALNALDHPQLDAVLTDLGANAVWVRPDRYIAAVAEDHQDLPLPTLSLFEPKTTKDGYETGIT